MYNHKYECLFDGSKVLLNVKHIAPFVEFNSRRGYYLIKTPETLANDAYQVYFDQEVKL